jgi:hypothetical protein
MSNWSIATSRNLRVNVPCARRRKNPANPAVWQSDKSGPVFIAKRINFLSSYLCFDAVFHAVAGAFNYYGFGMMKKSIEDGRGNSAIAVED